MINIQIEIDDLRVLQLVSNTHSLASLAKAYFGYRVGEAKLKALKIRIKELAVDTKHWKGRIGKTEKKPRTLQTEELFNRGRHTPTLKRRIISENLIPYECSKCTNKGIWQEEPLILQLDHIDGDRLNNKLDNLRFLCPNCHCQTPTWGTKNFKVRLPKEDKILLELAKTMSFSEIARKYGCSPSHVSKRLGKYYTW